MAFAADTPIVFKLFPLIHVAVGLYLIYFTLCQFINKTNIEIDDDYLTIRHSPIPWIRGNIEIPTNEIDQLYVKESKSTNKNGTTYSYALRAKLRNTKDKEILSVTGVENTEMLEIEEQLERFIGIVDRPVKGEYNRKPDKDAIPEPRRQHRNFTDSPLGTFYFLENGELFNLKGEELKTVSTLQYDWNDGESDKLFQFTTTEGKERLLYFDQNKALLDVFEEDLLNYSDVGTINFNKKEVPKVMVISGQSYQLMFYKKGKKFITGGVQGIEVEQWIYHSEDKQSNIRVINNDGVFKYYRGVKLSESDFEEPLDLNSLPEKNVDHERPADWDEKDLV